MKKTDRHIAVSVIMPVYNSAEFLREAAESILNQDFDRYELLLVDDGSTDGSGKICDELAGSDPHVRVFHQKNSGMCAARNAGMREAEGEYITFCDNDDVVLPGFLAQPYALAEKTGADAVRFCRKRIVTRDDEVLFFTETGGFPETFIPAEQIGSRYADIKSAGNAVWAGMYRRAFLAENDLFFDEEMRYGYEDTYFNLQCLHCGASIALLPETLYIWKCRMEHSTSGKFHTELIAAIKKCILLENTLAEEYDIGRKNSGLLTQVLTKEYISDLYFRMAPERSVNLSDTDRKKILEEFRDDRELLFIPSFAGAVKTLRSGWKNLLIWELFLHRKTWLLYRLIYRR